MTVFYQGLDCATIQESDLFQSFHELSQGQVAWASQPKYGYYTIYYGAASIGLLFFKHLFTYYRDKLSVKNNRTTGSGFFSSLFDVLAAYCRLFGYRPTPNWLIALSFPRNIGQTLYMLATAIFLFGVCLIPHFWYRACLAFGSPPLAIRAGIMSASLTPFIFLLSGKKNYVSYLTGYTYEKVNWLHQFVGLGCFVLALIHVIPFIHQPLQEGGIELLKEKFTTDSDYKHGLAALVCLFVLVTMFNRNIRKRIYEISFHLHWLVACAFFALLTFHVYGMLDMQNYLWATLAIWATQWIHRVLRSGLTSVREAEIVKVSENAMQISVFNVKGYSWSPGQHCFLRFPGIRIFDNHPFTVASVMDEDYMKFIVVPKSGLTRQMYQKLDLEVQKTKVLVDGPYGGCTRNPLAFDKVFLLSTGSGISGTLPYLTQLSGIENGPEIFFFCVLRTFEDVQWVRLEIEQSVAVGGERVNVVISITDMCHFDEKKSITGVTMLSGKPNFNSVVASLGPELGKRNIFVSCGSHSMSRTVSVSVAQLQLFVLLGGVQNVEEVFLHSEVFGW